MVLAQGHATVEIFYDAGEWSFFLDGTEGGMGRFPAEQVICHLTEATRLTIPSSSTFAFLGEPGNPVWIAPHIEAAGVLLLGYLGSELPPGC